MCELQTPTKLLTPGWCKLGTMEFALLFIIAFVIGAAIFAVGYGWGVAVTVPIIVFCISVLTDADAREAWAFTLLFGVPLVFFASLLGTYVIQLRRPEEVEPETDEDQSNTE